jgi:hypothetical protein
MTARLRLEFIVYGSGNNEISDGTPAIEGSEGRGERWTVNGGEVTGGWWTWLDGSVSDGQEL